MSERRNAGRADTSGSDASIDLSVIVVNWNAAHYLAAAFDSLLVAQGVLAERGYNSEIWLIDNASSDGSLALVRAQYPQVQVVENRENLGFAAGNNQGMARAAGRYYLLLNPDTELPPVALLALMEALGRDARIGIVGPRLQGATGKVQGGSAGYDPSPATIFNFATFLYRLFPGHVRGLWLPRSLYDSERPIAVDWVSGACMMLKREVIAAAGPMDERYFMYSEDVDLCRRARAVGFTVLCLPAVHVTHHIGGSSRQRGPEFYAHNIDSLDIDLRSRYSAPLVGLMHLVGAFGFLLRYLIYEVQLLRWHSRAFADLRDLWAACLKTSLLRVFRPAEKAITVGRRAKVKGQTTLGT